MDYALASMIRRARIWSRSIRPGSKRKWRSKRPNALEKRSKLLQLNSKDPTVRLQRAEKWPVVHALVGAKLWEDGIGYLVIARQEAEGRLIFGVYLADVYCLGVKNAFWSAGTPGDFKELIQKMGKTQTMIPISPACLVKILEGAVEYARSFGFPPHPDYRHAAMLLKGIDPNACATNSRSAATANLSTSKDPTSRPHRPGPSCNESMSPEDTSSFRHPVLIRKS